MWSRSEDGLLSELRSTVGEKLSTAPLMVEHGQDEHLESGSSVGPVVGVVLATVVLYFAKDILMPLTMAALLAVIFSPIASRLDRFVGSFVTSELALTLRSGLPLSPFRSPTIPTTSLRS